MRRPGFADTLDGSVPGATLHLYAWGLPGSRSAIWGGCWLILSWAPSRLRAASARAPCFDSFGAPFALRFDSFAASFALCFDSFTALCAMLRFLRRPLCAPEFRLDPGARLRQHILKALALDRGPAAHPILGLYTNFQKLFTPAPSGVSERLRIAQPPTTPTPSAKTHFIFDITCNIFFSYRERHVLAC